MGKKLEGKVAIVTAGACGIGKEISRAFIKEGCTVVMAQRKKKTLDEAEQEFKAFGGKVLSVQTDVSNEQQVIDMVNKTYDTFGRIDILVNNTGVAGPINNLIDMKLEEWNEALAIDLNGAMLCSREVLKHMIPQNTGGSIIMIGAEASRIADGWGGYPTRASYMACKAAVRGMQAAMAVEVGPYNIRVNTLSPGAVNSQRMVNVMQAYADAKGVTVEERIEEEKTKYSLRRFTEPEDIGSCCVFLASTESKCITNQTIACSSGMAFMASQVEINDDCKK